MHPTGLCDHLSSELAEQENRASRTKQATHFALQHTKLESSDVVECLEVGERSLGEDSLGNHTTEGKHSQAAVCDFLQLHVSFVFGCSALEEAERIQTKVTRLASGSVQHLGNSNG
mmetsp:Transcript_7283/g.20266  ORF Transcript_7283/g.20266 Transcript_7283/m.20266 type:complete len:116 (+) Transcript_7283:217-564(+)